MPTRLLHLQAAFAAKALMAAIESSQTHPLMQDNQAPHEHSAGCCCCCLFLCRSLQLSAMLVGQLTLLLVLCAETGGRRLPTSARPRDTFLSLMWRIRALLQVLIVDVLQAVFVCCEFLIMLSVWCL